VEDCALAAENLMLAAHGVGLGSCWIGLAQGLLNTPDGNKDPRHATVLDRGSTYYCRISGWCERARSAQRTHYALDRVTKFRIRFTDTLVTPVHAVGLQCFASNRTLGLWRE